MNFPKFKTYSKNLFLFFISFFILSASLFSGLVVNGAYVKSDDNIVFEEERVTDNVYLFGSKVESNSRTNRDLLIFANEIFVNQDVGRFLFASGFQVNVDTDRVGGSVQIVGGEALVNTKSILGSVRIVAGEAKIQGVVQEDVMVLADKLEIVDANILGDVYFFGSSLEVKNSRIAGDLVIKSDNNFEAADFSKTVEGEVKINSANESLFRLDGFGLAGLTTFLVIGWVINTLVVLAIIYGLFLLLKKFDKFELEKSYNLKTKTYYLDILIGLAGVASVFVIFGFSFLGLFFGLFGIIFSAFLILAAVIYLVRFYTPIHFAGVLKNSFNLKISDKQLILVSLLALILLLPLIFLGGLLLFLIYLASFGYLLRKTFIYLRKKFLTDVEKQKSAPAKSKPAKVSKTKTESSKKSTKSTK